MAEIQFAKSSNNVLSKNFYKNNLYDIRLVIRGDDDYKLLALKKLQIKYLDQIYVIFKRDDI